MQVLLRTCAVQCPRDGLRDSIVYTHTLTSAASRSARLRLFMSRALLRAKNGMPSQYALAKFSLVPLMEYSLSLVSNCNLPNATLTFRPVLFRYRSRKILLKVSTDMQIVGVILFRHIFRNYMFAKDLNLVPSYNVIEFLWSFM